MRSDHWDYSIRNLHSEAFFLEMSIEFSEISSELNEEDDELIHSKMEVFSDYTIKQIKFGNTGELKRCLNFIESKIDHIDLELVNALTVSYCESLMLGEIGSEMKKIVELMGPKLRDQYLDYQEYYYNLEKGI